MMAEIALIQNSPADFTSAVSKIYAAYQFIKAEYDHFAHEVLYGVPGFIYILIQLQRLV
jgi:hypothetical protein